MGLRFESNYIYFAGVAPFPIDATDVLQKWWRVHEWNVDVGFTGKLLMVMLNVEPTYPVPVTLDYGWMRVKAMVNNASRSWVTCFETKMNGAAMTAKMFTPRLVIMPTGDGITFTVGQGLLTQALGGTTGSNRWWSCYVIEANST